MRVIYIVVSVALILGLTIVGYNYFNKVEIIQPVQTTPIPAVSIQVTAVPQATPTPNTTATPTAVNNASQVMVLLNKNTFNKGEAIKITIKNGSNQPIKYLLGPDCGIFFESQVNGEFKQQTIAVEDGSAGTCVTYNLGPSENTIITRTIQTSTTSGTYRIRFQSYSGSVYSQTLEIR